MGGWGVDARDRDFFERQTLDAQHQGVATPAPAEKPQRLRFGVEGLQGNPCTRQKIRGYTSLV